MNKVLGVLWNFVFGIFMKWRGRKFKILRPLYEVKLLILPAGAHFQPEITTYTVNFWRHCEGNVKAKFSEGMKIWSHCLLNALPSLLYEGSTFRFWCHCIMNLNAVPLDFKEYACRFERYYLLYALPSQNEGNAFRFWMQGL